MTLRKLHTCRFNSIPKEINFNDFENIFHYKDLPRNVRIQVDKVSKNFNKDKEYIWHRINSIGDQIEFGFADNVLNTKELFKELSAVPFNQWTDEQKISVLDLINSLR